MTWYSIQNETGIPSPAILLYPDRIRENIRRMIAMAGSPNRLRPHVKTYKLEQVVKFQLEAGITRFKCATLSEALMLAKAGATDILVAYPLYRPALQDFMDLRHQFPGAIFSLLIDSAEHAQMVNALASEYQTVVPVFMDLDVGMHRTGTPPGKALEVVRYLHESESLQPIGLHLYDGHLHQPELRDREWSVAEYYKKVDALIARLQAHHLPVGETACGGTPTFSIHARFSNRTLCPGTIPLWDYGYSSRYQELDFLHAALVLCRVISKTDAGYLTLDMGYKAVASEMTPPRVVFPEIQSHEMINHSEEHLVIQTTEAGKFSVGDCLYAIPYHICPTIGLHDFVWSVVDQKAVEKWQVTARTRALTIYPG